MLLTRFSIRLLLTVTLLFLFSIVWPFFLELIGFHTLSPGWKVAEQIIAKEGNVKECRKIVRGIWWDVFSPPTGEKRALCIHEYAKLVKDPSACELLMPSEYGLSCIGEIWGPLIDESNCHWYKSNQVRCFEGKELVPRIYSCELTDMESLPDECIHRIAFKEKNIEECNKIGNASLQAICKTRIAIWNQHPQLRSTIYFNDNID